MSDQECFHEREPDHPLTVREGAKMGGIMLTVFALCVTALLVALHLLAR